MSKSNVLSAVDRDFLRLLAEAAATNPFRKEHFNLLPKIAARNTSVLAEEQYKRVLVRVSKEVRRMEEAGSVNVEQYRGV